MYHQSNIFFVNTHAKGGCGDNDAYFVIHEGILVCNFLVCIAVWMASAAKSVPGKILAVFFTIMTFVVPGFEHSVANMYYLTAGVLAGAELSAADALLGNLLPVTIGNIIGGAVFLGGGCWYIYRKGTDRNA